MTRSTAIILMGLVLLPPAAVAQDGVLVDPDSPAGREYAIPLEEARRNAVGGHPTGRPAADPPLFGAGIEERSESSPKSQRDGGSVDGPTRESSRGDRTDGIAAGANGSAAVSAAAGGSNTAVIAGIVGAVLAAAALAGFALRRALRDG